MTAAAARLAGITKRFGALVALDGADLELRRGEVHGVLGENGAGKTTLLGVLAGMVRPDAGSVGVDGVDARIGSPRDAWSLGVGMVHQHFTLVPKLSVLENLALGMRSRAGGLRLPYEDVRGKARRLAERTGLSVPLDASVESLGVGDRQRVEILKTLLREPSLLILDEPTAVLTPGETEALFGLLRELAGEGRAVALVAHKLDEVLAVADRVTVLRHGRTVRSAPREDVDVPGLIRAMVGEGARTRAAATLPEEAVDREAVGETLARLDGVRARGARGEWAVDGVSLTVRRGELVGIAGVEGNGQRELARLLAGRLRPDEGRVELPSRIGFVPQDRTTEGIVGDFDLAENVALAHLRDPAASGWTLPWGRIRARTRELMRAHDVRAEGPGVRARTLSGGNQQRLVVAREIDAAGDLLVAENPTRGLDVAATAFVHGELSRILRAETPCGVVLISTDLDEVLALSDRVLVMVRGRLHPVPDGARSRAEVGALMLAGDDEAA